MFTEVTEKVFITPSGQKLEQTTPAIMLNVNGERKLVPARELENMHLDTDYLEDASLFCFEYQGFYYEVPIPEKGTADWETLQEIVDPE